MATGARNITTTGQIGDGREAAAVEYVLKQVARATSTTSWLPSTGSLTRSRAEANAVNAR
jgi:hypothetical protein